MTFIKKNKARLFVCCQLFVCALFYYFGHQGIRHIQKMRSANAHAQEQVVALQAEIVACEHELDQWSKFDFFKEKIARERLQMARSTDMVFYLTDATHGKYSKSTD